MSTDPPTKRWLSRTPHTPHPTPPPHIPHHPPHVPPHTSTAALVSASTSTQTSPASATTDNPNLAHSLGVHRLIAQLLTQRGLHDPTDIERFLSPNLKHLHDPALLPGCTDAAQHLVDAVRQNRPIVIYGDYDVDGITASAILWHMLTLAASSSPSTPPHDPSQNQTQNSPRVTTYVPHRIDEGYGLNFDALQQIASDHDNPLIVSVDCGITAIDVAHRAKQAGIDLIITDHHEFAHESDGFPDALALVHPRLPIIDPDTQQQSPSPYPFDGLCGAGVAFKLAWQFAKTFCGSDRLPDDYRAVMLDLISLAALGTVADVVPLLDENRVITHFGLGHIQRTNIIGLNALIDAARLRQETIDAYHVGFVIGPRINACGRMGHAEEAVQLLTCADHDQAADIAVNLCNVNEQRKATERDVFNLAHQMVIDNDYATDDRRAIVVGGYDWHPGVLGIVASRLVESFCRPVIVLNFDTETQSAHGSARSIDGVSIHEALQQCDPLLTRWGGHAMAAGMRLPIESVDAFREQFVEAVNAMIEPEALTPVVQYDLTCQLHDLTDDLFNQVRKLAPFGRSNPTPVLCVHQAQLAQASQRMGQSGKHLRTALQQGQSAITAIGWSMGDLAESLPRGATVDLAFEPRLSTWQGRTRRELLLKDIRMTK